jgi:hypothetical protein
VKERAGLEGEQFDNAISDLGIKRQEAQDHIGSLFKTYGITAANLGQLNTSNLQAAFYGAGPLAGLTPDQLTKLTLATPTQMSQMQEQYKKYTVQDEAAARSSAHIAQVKTETMGLVAQDYQKALSKQSEPYFAGLIGGIQGGAHGMASYGNKLMQKAGGSVMADAFTEMRQGHYSKGIGSLFGATDKKGMEGYMDRFGSGSIGASLGEEASNLMGGNAAGLCHWWNTWRRHWRFHSHPRSQHGFGCCW